MSNQSISIPAGMIFKTFHCHKCGKKLVKTPETRIVRPGSPDYREHSSSRRLHMVGDIEVTEYHFRCPDCENTVEYDEQCLIASIQKKLCRKKLSDEEIERHRPEAENAIALKKKITSAIFFAIALIVFVLMWYFSAKS